MADFAGDQGSVADRGFLLVFVVKTAIHLVVVTFAMGVSVEVAGVETVAAVLLEAAEGLAALCPAVVVALVVVLSAGRFFGSAVWDPGHFHGVVVA